MTDSVSSSVSGLAPEGLEYVGNSLQEQKSARMRTKILEATLDCLTIHGYANTSNNLICSIAKVSRGAMLYHYPTRHDLLSDVIEYAFYQHMRAFSQRINSLSETDRVNHNIGIALDWEACQSKPFQAYLELRVAARTNKELRRIFVPRFKHHDQVWKDELLKSFPEWRNDLKKLDLTRRFIRAILEGLTMSRDLRKEPETEWILLEFTSQIGHKLLTGDLSFSSDAQVKAFRKLVEKKTSHST